LRANTGEGMPQRAMASSRKPSLAVRTISGIIREDARQHRHVAGEVTHRARRNRGYGPAGTSSTLPVPSLFVTPEGETSTPSKYLPYVVRRCSKAPSRVTFSASASW
jgi:hypothetical protein